MLQRVHVKEAVMALSRGDMVVIPTETVYGLAAPINSEKALKNVFALKSRPLLDPLIVHIGHLRQVHEVTKHWFSLADVLAKRFWPGPLTLVMEKAGPISPLITANLSTVALRMPQHPLTLKIINECGIPLAAPSANRFGHISPTLLEHVERDLVPEMKKQKKQKTLWAVDGGPCDLGLESTVLQIKPSLSLNSLKKVEVHPLTLLRPGPIGQSEIQTFLEKKGFQIQWESFQASSSQGGNQPSFRAPGQMQSHYAPHIPFVLCREAPQENHQKEWTSYFDLSSSCRPVELTLSADPVQAAQELYGKMRLIEEKASPEDVMFFVFLPKVHRSEKWREWTSYFDLSSSCRPVELTLSADPVQAAQELYGKMRLIEEKADSSPEDVMFFVFLPKVHRSEKWRAILDRIQKAAHKKDFLED